MIFHGNIAWKRIPRKIKKRIKKGHYSEIMIQVCTEKFVAAMKEIADMSNELLKSESYRLRLGESVTLDGIYSKLLESR